MASIIKKKIRGQTYYYAVESKRVDGKPRIVWQKYLGKVGDIVRAVSAAGKPEPVAARLYSFGVEAALLGIARRLGIEDVIDRHAGRPGAGPGAGEYMLIYAIHTCAGAEGRVSRWFERTVLRRHFKAGPRTLTEKRFRCLADSLPAEALERIQFDLAGRVISEFGVGTRGLIYHGIRPGQIRGRGGRSAAAAPGIGLLVSADFLVPLFYKIYPRTFLDEAAYRKCTEELLEKYRRLLRAEPDATVVMHRHSFPGRPASGADPLNCRILGLLPEEESRDLPGISPDRFYPLKGGRRDRVKVWRFAKEESGRYFSVLVVKSGAGRQVFYTDNLNWDNEEIYGAFTGRAELEELLSCVKKESAGWKDWPEGDALFNLHVFCVVLGLLLQTLLRRELHRYGIKGSVRQILGILSGIQEVAVVYPGDEKRKRRRECLALTEMDPVQREIYERLCLNRFEAGG